MAQPNAGANDPDKEHLFKGGVTCATGPASCLRSRSPAAVVMAGNAALTQGTAPTNSAPNPYRTIASWGTLPEGRSWGSTSAVAIDRDGTTVWVAERCGESIPPSRINPALPFACDGSKLDPILKFDPSGKLLKSFGAGLLLFPHGMHVDRAGNVWVTDGLGRGGKGHQVFKFSPDGKVLLTLGKANTPGSGPDEFNAPSAVVTRAQRRHLRRRRAWPRHQRADREVRQGREIHQDLGPERLGRGANSRPRTRSRWIRAGGCSSATARTIAFRSSTRRATTLDQWHQFSRPSGVFIDKNDIIYVADSESESVAKNHDGWKRGIRVGKVSDGAVTAFIPDPVEKTTGTSAAEGVAADAMGNIYGAEVGPRRMMKYVKN